MQRFDVAVRAAGDGPTLVWLHGAGGPRPSVALDLLAERFRLVMPTLPGWGSEPNSAMSFDELAAQLWRVLDTVGIEQCHLGGSSFGASCALHGALAQPDRVSSLVLDGPLHGPGGVAAQDPYVGALPIEAIRARPDPAPGTEPVDAALMGRVGPLVETLLATAGSATERPSADDLEQRLSELMVPTLVLVGTNDGVVDPEIARSCRRVLANSVLAFVHDAAHDVSADRPEAFADAVGDFLTRGMQYLINDTDGVINP